MLTRDSMYLHFVCTMFTLHCNYEFVQFVEVVCHYIYIWYVGHPLTIYTQYIVLESNFAHNTYTCIRVERPPAQERKQGEDGEKETSAWKERNKERRDWQDGESETGTDEQRRH